MQKLNESKEVLKTNENGEIPHFSVFSLSILVLTGFGEALTAASPASLGLSELAWTVNTPVLSSAWCFSSV